MIKLKIKFEDGHRYSFWGEIIESMYGYICLKNIRDQADNIVKDFFKLYEPTMVSSKNMNIGDIIRFDARVKASEGIVSDLDNVTKVKLVKKENEEIF
jgi:hypothetical protein